MFNAVVMFKCSYYENILAVKKVFWLVRELKFKNINCCDSFEALFQTNDIQIIYSKTSLWNSSRHSLPTKTKQNYIETT